MRISVKVTPRSSQKKVVNEGDMYKVYVHESATDGKANTAVISLLAKYFSISKSDVRIVKGLSSRNKIIEIITDNNGEN